MDKTEYIKVPPDHPVALASDDDRAWFDDHPDRIIRLRWPTDGDDNPVTGPKQWWSDEAVIVFCPLDGVRVRLNVHLEPDGVAALLLRSATDTDDDLVPDLYRLLGEASGPKLQRVLVACLEAGGRLSEWPAGLEP